MYGRSWILAVLFVSSCAGGAMAKDVTQWGFSETPATRPDLAGISMTAIVSDDGTGATKATMTLSCTHAGSMKASLSMGAFDRSMQDRRHVTYSVDDGTEHDRTWEVPQDGMGSFITGDLAYVLMGEMTRTMDHLAIRDDQDMRARIEPPPRRDVLPAFVQQCATWRRLVSPADREKGL